MIHFLSWSKESFFILNTSVMVDMFQDTCDLVGGGGMDVDMDFGQSNLSAALGIDNDALDINDLMDDNILKSKFKTSREFTERERVSSDNCCKEFNLKLNIYTVNTGCPKNKKSCVKIFI